MSLSTSIVEDDRALVALTAPWWTLWLGLAHGLPFQSPAWLLPWWRNFRPGRLCVVTVHDGTALVGLAPLYRELRAEGHRLLPLGISLSDRLDILAAPGRETEACAAITRTLEECSSWSSWCMPELPASSLVRSLVPRSVHAVWSAGSVCPVLSLSGKEGLAHVPASKRRKLRMSRHRLERTGTGRIVSGRDLAPAPWFAHLERLHGARWRARGETGVLEDAAAAAFHREALGNMLDAGLARLYGLEIDGRMAGVYYGFLHSGVAYAYLGGFDPNDAWLSPGTLLMGHAIAEAAREGASELDLLRGSEPYKHAWGACDRLNESLWAVREPAVTVAA